MSFSSSLTTAGASCTGTSPTALARSGPHLRRILTAYFAYYHRSRTHPSLGKDAPVPPSGHGDFVKPDRLRAALHAAQKKLCLPDLTWYQSTRHTFASHWVMDGCPIEKLRDILGHSTVQVTERYAHLSPDAFGREDYAAVFVDLAAIPEPSGTDQKTGAFSKQRKEL